MKTGFAAVIGRPNVGKSTLLNQMIGTKVSITSARPNTTRLGIRGILHRPDAQVVFVDTPGMHRPRSPLGARLNATAAGSVRDVEVVLAVLDATASVGPGDRRVLAQGLDALGHREDPRGLLVVVNKVDTARPAETLSRLAEAQSALEQLAAEGHGPRAQEAAEFFPVSAVTGRGVPDLVETVVGLLEEGPPYYPEDMVSDLPEAVRVAELVREQLLAHCREELPHSIACRVTEWEGPVIRCEILVERESQKGIVIGQGGLVLKAVGSAVRAQLPPGAFVELFVRVEKRWQQRPETIERLGY
jgi:GTP-binding protein Era